MIFKWLLGIGSQIMFISTLYNTQNQQSTIIVINKVNEIIHFINFIYKVSHILHKPGLRNLFGHFFSQRYLINILCIWQSRFLIPVQCYSSNDIASMDEGERLYEKHWLVTVPTSADMCLLIYWWSDSFYLMYMNV